MSCPRKLFLFVLAEVSLPRRPLQANLGMMFERKAKISCNDGRSVTRNLRAMQDSMRTSRKTDFHQKNETSAWLKMTFVDMTYPGQCPELPSLSRHFLLVETNHNSVKFSGKIYIQYLPFYQSLNLYK